MIPAGAFFDLGYGISDLELRFGIERKKPALSN
jgi:hypothetical protein